MKTWQEFKGKLGKPRPVICIWQVLSKAFSPPECGVGCAQLSPPPSLQAGRSPAPRVLTVLFHCFFQSPSPGSSSPLGAESSSTPLHPSDPAEGSTNKEVGCRFLSKASSPSSSIPILACAFPSLPQRFCPQVSRGETFLLSSVEWGE